MDINELRTAVTLISMVVFLAIVAWVYSKKRDQRSFDELAALSGMRICAS
jgi:cytochrome c oxidase cbb3-type subunit 4